NTPFTDVFSDPLYDHGHGERTFVNSIGAAGELRSAHIPDEFFTADVVCFGGTALVPQIHDDLSNLLRRVKKNGKITVVNTVFDFRNEKKYPDRPWPLVDHLSDYKLIDVLILDCEEAIRISGTKEMDQAAVFFKDAGVSAFLITNGSKYIIGYSDGRLFNKQDISKFPVSDRVVQELKKNPQLKGDTTGCGDNFVGGFIASLAQQLKSEKKEPLSFIEAISWAVASGGFSCFHVGGTYYEESRGEKLAKIKDYQQAYIKHTGNGLQ
ncbi:MAG: carbohydrate kinase family protein, partial [Candidatus Aminicenantes bacterium]